MSQYPPGMPNQYPPNTGTYPPNTGGYPPNTGGYPPNTGGYPPNTGGYPPNTGGYPPNTGGYPPTSPGYPPGQNTVQYPNAQPPQFGVPQQQGFPSPQGYPPGQGFPSPSGGVPPNQQPLPGGFPPNDKLQMDTEPGAPPLSVILNLPGYEGVTFDSSALRPPTYDQIVSTPTVPRDIIQKAPSLTAEEARDALIQYVSEHCCYGSKAAKQMEIRNIHFNSAIHYKLETFGEKRETFWTFEPFKGQETAVHIGGHAPGPWEIQVTNSKGNFHYDKKEVEVPNTSTLKPCHKCLAIGRVRCRHCQGLGRKQCTWCNGKGIRTRMDTTEQCHTCSGSGHDRCTFCHGFGQRECDTCRGHCQLRYYIKMKVTWENHVDDHISDTEHLPGNLIRSVTGETAFEDEQPRVWPVTNFPDQGVVKASHNLTEKHRTAFPDEHILMQRQQVRIVPIAEVSYSWKSTEDKFFVYGFEHKVYFPDYPQQCCCGCLIL